MAVRSCCFMITLLLNEQVLNGLQSGIVLFLMAAGLTLIFGVMGLINLAHGSLFMAGGFDAAVAGAKGSFVLALSASIAAAAGPGAIIEIALIHRLNDRDHLDWVLASHAQSYVLLIESWTAIEGTRSMPVIWLVAVAAPALSALAIAALSLQKSGLYFTMITLALWQMFFYFSITWPAYGGEDGLRFYERNDFPGLNRLDPIQFFATAFAIPSLVLWGISRLACAPLGLALNAACQPPGRVETMRLTPFACVFLPFSFRLL